MTRHGIELNSEAIGEFCRRWRIRQLEVFGSILPDEFRPDSDIDLLATFDDDAEWSILDIVQMEQELTHTLGRRVDLVERRSIERSPNYLRRQSILHSAERVYAQS